MIKTRIKLDKLISLLGEYKKEGSEYLFQCPYCVDKSKNNLSFNIKKEFLWCFASNGEHSKRWLKEVYNLFCGDIFSKQPQDSPKVFMKKINLSSGQIRKFNQYAYMSNKELLSNPKYLEVLENMRGINKNTVKDCLIGLDLMKGRFVFPSIEFVHEAVSKVVGFEYRPLDLTKNGLYRSKNTPTGIVQINSCTPQTENLIIFGGYIDSYTFYQYLSTKDEVGLYHITTSSNGEVNTLKHLKQIENSLSNYKQLYLYLDSDSVGIAAMKSVKAAYPQFEIITMNCGCKDFNEHYLNCIKASAAGASEGSA